MDKNSLSGNRSDAGPYVVLGPSLATHVLPQIPGVESPSAIDERDQLLAELGFDTRQQPDAMIGGQVLFGTAVEALAL